MALIFTGNDESLFISFKHSMMQEFEMSYFMTPHSRGSVDYPSTRGIQVDVGVPDTTSENQVESPLYEELYPNKTPA